MKALEYSFHLKNQTTLLPPQTFKKITVVGVTIIISSSSSISITIIKGV